MMIRTTTVCAAGTCILLGGAPLFVVTGEMVGELSHQPCAYGQCAMLPADSMLAPHPEEGSSATGSFQASLLPTTIMASSTGELPPGQQETGGVPQRPRVSPALYEGSSGTPLPLLASTT
jgi:hypothetical protein